MAADRPPSTLFASWARFVLRFRFPLIVLVLGLTALAVFQIKNKLRMDNSVEAFSATRSEANQVLEEFRDEFGRDDVFLIIAEGQVFSKPYLDKVAALDKELAALNMEIPSLGERKADRDKVRGVAAQAPAKPKSKPAAPAGDEFGDLDDEFGDMGDEAMNLDDEFADLEEEEGWGSEAGGSVVDEVISIVSVRKTRAKSGGIEVGELMDPLPETPEQIQALKDEVLGNPAKGISPSQTLIGQVVNAEGTHSAIVVRTNFMNEEDSARVYAKLKDMVKTYEGPDFKVWIAGGPAMTSSLNDLMLDDMRTLMSLSILMLLAVLIVMFRHPIGALSPIVVVVLSALWALGIMATLGMAMTMLSNILPAFIICVGVADSVHLLSVYRDYRRRGNANDESIVGAVASTAVPILFTTLTTAMGLLSFIFATMDAIGEMGLIGAIAVGLACLHTLLVLPIALSFNKKSLMGVSDTPHKPDLIDKFLAACVGLSAGGPSARLRTLGIAVLLGAVAGYGASTLRVWHNPLSWVPDDQPIQQAVQVADAHMGGTANVQLLIDAHGERGVKDETLIKGIEQLDRHIRDYVHAENGEKIVGNVISVVDIVRESNQSLLGGDPAHYEVPDGQRAVSDRFFAFENAGPDQLKRLMTLDASRTQMTVRMDWMEATSYFAMRDYIRAGVDKYIPADKATVKLTGSVFLVLTTVGALVLDLIRSFGVAFATITVLMMFLLRSVKLGVIAMVPNLLPIVFILGIMGVLGIPIDMANLMIASIALGIAVDDTIHFLHQFRVAYDRTGSVEGSIAHSLRHSGRALVVTSVVLCGGFLVFLGGTMFSLQRFGALIAGTVVMALLLDLILTPALLRMAYKDRAPVTERDNEKGDVEHAALPA